MRLARVAVVVADYDEAIEYYTRVLGFMLVEDTPLEAGKRWVVVAPSRDGGAALLLAKATKAEQLSRVGNQTGGRVFLFLHTDDFDGDYSRLRSAGVRFVEEPRVEAYGRVVVFQDLYGNKWDLVERSDT
ncbi:MAG TPA: VOC family protein [Gemmatimonadaceae bacterium]|nr:VOC family protein [Gemmatimonadaceae bacterium]